MKQRLFFILIISIIFALSCAKEKEISDTDGKKSLLSVPVGFPQPIFPSDNAFSEVRFILGKKLFYDKRLSMDRSISCASCHNSNLAFSDSIQFSPGVNGRPGFRNAPTLANVAYHPYYTREGGVPTLEMQILVPIQEHNEFDFNILLIGDRLKSDTSYLRLSMEAYGQSPDYFVITRSIACFERTMISGHSKYDDYKYNGNKSALSDNELKGMSLFFSDRTNCSKCHSGFNFTNYSFENNGLYQTYADSGRMRLTGLEIDRGLFKVPTLRNIEVTAPYMHDGSLPTLEKVIDHYISGGADFPNKSSMIKPLLLNAEEKRNLIAFLKSLTDQEFLNNPKFKL